jgi:hypothetical protein
MVQPLHIRGAHVWDGNSTVQRDLYTTDRIVDKPAPSALTVDLDGYTIFPGLINAHDHLELNHYPRSKFRDKYDNAHQWGEDMNARLDTEPYKSLRAYPLWDKLFIGGLKNLLCGATTVAHHNPPHKELWHKDFPVRVLRKYGWSHSLHFSTDEEIIHSYRSTPPDVPWFIHLAEGTDEIAAGEYQRLKALGCVGKNTMIVHGVGISNNETNRMQELFRGLVICPSTNSYLLDTTPDLYDEKYPWIADEKLVIGSDSRLTSNNDLLGELRLVLKEVDEGLDVIMGYDNEPAEIVIPLVTFCAAHVLGVSDIGSLNTDNHADFLMISTISDASASLCTSRRADLTLVVKGGVPQIGDPDVMAKFPHIKTVTATLDGKPKLIQSDLAERITKCRLKESGLEIDHLPARKFWRFS